MAPEIKKTKNKKRRYFKARRKKNLKIGLKEEESQRCEHTKHANLAWQAAGGQRWLSVVVVVRADVLPQVRGTTGHAEGRGTEEARAERACVRRGQGGKCVGWRDGWRCDGWGLVFHYTPCHYCSNCCYGSFWNEWVYISCPDVHMWKPYNYNYSTE